MIRMYLAAISAAILALVALRWLVEDDWPDYNGGGFW